jgi:hypothetical protein
MDINGDGIDEILVSSWDGQTFIVTQDGAVSTFFFDEEITAFACGKFSLNGALLPVLIYVTFTNKIYVYYKVSLSEGGELRKISPTLVDMDDPSTTEYLLYSV